MKKIIILAALAFSAAAVKAGELALPGLPGMEPGSPGESVEDEISRPDPQKLLSGLGSELHLSDKQKERISAAVEKKLREFDKLSKEYDKASAEEKKWRYQVNELKYEMAGINKNMPAEIRSFLDDEQRQTYDGILASRNKPEAPENSIETSPAAPADEPVKPARKRKLVRRKKLKAGAGSALPSAGELPAAAPAAPEEEQPGQVMVDKDRAAARAATAPRKRRVLRKKNQPAAGEAAPAEDLMSNDPAGVSGKEAPADAAEDAGSYP